MYKLRSQTSFKIKGSSRQVLTHSLPLSAWRKKRVIRERLRTASLPLELFSLKAALLGCFVCVESICSTIALVCICVSGFCMEVSEAANK